jgi:exosortase D (VPLPA-CTERM-specific)
MNFAGARIRFDWKPLLIALAVLIVYLSVIVGLVKQWFNDGNYSHGLIIPFVVGFIVWKEFRKLQTLSRGPEFSLGLLIVFLGLIMLLVGTLGSELLSQRVSLLVVLAGTVIYFFGRRVLFTLSVPFALLLLAIPIPQIIFNKIAFPLQLLATRAAHAFIVLYGVPSERKGNVIELVTIGGSKVALEVAEACSGIRTLMTLMTLGLIYAYFTREERPVINERFHDIYKDPNLWRTVILILCTVPIALITNAGRVLLTGIATYYYGQQILESWWHDAFGWVTFGIAFIFLIAVSWALAKLRFKKSRDFKLSRSGETPFSERIRRVEDWHIASLVIALATAGLAINWLGNRPPPKTERLPFSQFPSRISNAMRMGADTKFNPQTEQILGASDYVMRNYIEPTRKFNLYIGYYETQRSGMTYHSPQNCLPGSGWEMSDGQAVEISSYAGTSFNANRYIVQQGDDRRVMIYWYQGRGRTNTSEYRDKLDTIIDSITTGRSDGSMVRVLAPVYAGETDAEALAAAKNFAAGVYEVIPRFVPD